MRGIAALLLLSSMVAACGGGGGGGGPVSIGDPYGTDGLSRRWSLGKCVGFTVTANGANVFAPDATVELGPLGKVPATRVDEKHLRVASPETNGACFFTPLFVPTGSWALTVKSGGDTWTVPTAIAMDPPAVTDAGAIDHDHVFLPNAAAVTATAGAWVLERPYDADVYRAEFSESYHVYAHVDFFGEGAPLPEMLFWEPAHPETNVARGGLALVFPEGGEEYIVVRDRLGQGSPSARYRLAFTGDELGTTASGDRCSDAPEITPRGYHVDYDSLHDDLDPDGACADSLYGDPIYAPGNDAVWKVTVPAGQQLRVATYDDHIDNVTYLLPLDGGCSPHPANCVAAAHHFGGGNTNVLLWNNDSGEDRTFFLVHDSATVMDQQVGTFMINVELFPPE